MRGREWRVRTEVFFYRTRKVAACPLGWSGVVAAAAAAALASALCASMYWRFAAFSLSRAWVRANSAASLFWRLLAAVVVVVDAAVDGVPFGCRLFAAAG